MTTNPTDQSNQPAPWSNWSRIQQDNSAWFRASPLLSKLERLARLAVFVSAGVVGIGVAKALIKVTGLFSKQTSIAFSEYLIPLSTVLVAGTLLTLIVLFATAACRRRSKL